MKTIATFSLLAASALAQSDPCKTAHTDQSSCDADKKTGGGCTWCKCGALPSACWTVSNSKKLPPGVYQCDTANNDATNPLIPKTTTLEKDRRHPLPKGWKVIGDSPRDTQIELAFAVRHSTKGKQLLEATLLETSDPTHAKYGQHLTNQQVNALIAPSDINIELVKSFLLQHDIQGVCKSDNCDWIVADVTVAQAEKMLGNGHKYQEIHHKDGHVLHRLRSQGYTLPFNVASAIDLVAPTTHVPTIRATKTKKKSITSPDGFLNVPSVLRKQYSMTDADKGKSTGRKQAVTGFLGQTYSESSLNSFYKLLCNGTLPCGQNKDASKVVCKGDKCAGGGGTESMLDIEYINAMGAGVDTEFWGFSGNNPYEKQQEPFMKWLYAVGNTTDEEIPKLFSTSYGEDEESIPMTWSDRTNTEFMKVGARGISLLFASGDSGASGDHGCDKDSAGNDLFVPQWPSGSPYVTAVGGAAGGSATTAETVAGLSSGGFSNRWARPKWQTDATATYLKNASGNLPSTMHYNDTGRGFPDIAAEAVDFVIVQFGIPLPGVSGTSCASPTAAGMFGLLNDMRASANKTSLGFLNPFIYQNGDKFNDIVKGTNNGCGFGTSGFPAAKGWDAATGWGSPNFAKLKAEALKLQ